MVSTSTGILLFLTCVFAVQAFINPAVGPGLSNCTFESDRCEWRSYDGTYEHPMQWVVTDDVTAFPPPLKGELGQREAQFTSVKSERPFAWHLRSQLLIYNAEFEAAPWQVDTQVQKRTEVGLWFAAVEMGNVPKLTMTATFMCNLFQVNDIDELKITFNYFFWIDPREANSGSAKLSLKYEIAVGGFAYPYHVLEVWNVTSSAGLKWNTANV